MIHDLGENLIPIMAIGCTCLTFVTWIIMATIDSIYKTRCNSRLKDRLVEMGRSPSEIDQYLRAGMPRDEDECVQPMPPVKTHSFPNAV